MKILLIQPASVDPLTDKFFLFEPLALEYLGAGIQEDGHEVQLLDARIDPYYENTCGGFDPDVVGLTGFTSHVNIIKTMACRIKAKNPKILIVVGGHHAQTGDAATGIHRQQGVEVTAVGIKRHNTGFGGCPAPPDRFAARVAGVAGFSGFLASVKITCRDLARVTGQDGTIRKHVVGRRADGCQQAEARFDKTVAAVGNGNSAGGKARYRLIQCIAGIERPQYRNRSGHMRRGL